MQFIILNGGRIHQYAIIDDPDYAYINSFNWSLINGYATTSIKNPNYKYPYKNKKRRIGIGMHRLIMRPPKGYVVHHKNFDKLDNRRKNLMVLTPTEHGKIHGEYLKERLIKRTL